MGLITALAKIADYARQQTKVDEEIADIVDFLTLPMEPVEDEAKSGRVIRVALNVADVDAIPLNVLGIEEIDFVEYGALGSVDEIKQKLIYKKPPGAATKWRFSPIHKMGKGKNSSANEFVKDKGHLDKFKDNILLDLENSKYLKSGATELITQQLALKIDRLAEIFCDKNRSYIMVLVVNDNGKFLYPKDVKAFLQYFKGKMSNNENMEDENCKRSDAKKNVQGIKEKYNCSLCYLEIDEAKTLNDIFKFATFDKESFLPGAKKGNGILEKTFPVCEKCFAALSAGREYVGRNFNNTQLIYGLNINIVPELVIDGKYNKGVMNHFADFIKNGIKSVDRTMQYLSRQNNTLVYNFLFTEQLQAQERVHLMIEDVPPLRLQALLNAWEDAVKNIVPVNLIKADEQHDLDKAFKTMYWTIINLAGKTESDKSVLRDKIINIFGRLLNGEKVDTKSLKMLMVSRFRGLFADSSWVRDKAFWEMQTMNIIIEFINIHNGGVENGD